MYVRQICVVLLLVMCVTSTRAKTADYKSILSELKDKDLTCSAKESQSSFQLTQEIEDLESNELEDEKTADYKSMLKELMKRDLTCSAKESGSGVQLTHEIGCMLSPRSFGCPDGPDEEFLVTSQSFGDFVAPAWMCQIRPNHRGCRRSNEHDLEVELKNEEMEIEDLASKELENEELDNDLETRLMEFERLLSSDKSVSLRSIYECALCSKPKELKDCDETKECSKWCRQNSRRAGKEDCKRLTYIAAKEAGKPPFWFGR